jgi:hypothetical protein
MMTGNELITITIEDGDKRISTTYGIMDGEEILETHSEYHLLMLSNLLKKFNDSKEKDIPWPSPLDYSKINTPKEKLDQNFKHGIRYIQG